MADTPTLAWQPQQDVWLLLVVVVGGYFYALSAWGPRQPRRRGAATRGQLTCFLAGAAGMWGGADWPIHPVGENYLYSVHMVQHLMFQLVAAPLMILGVPAWLWRRLLAPRPVTALMRIVTRPLNALLLVGTYTAILHVPSVVDAVVTNGWLHLAAHVSLFAMSLVMWWPVLSPLPELPHLSYPGRMAYLFGHSILPTVPASFLVFTQEPLYSAYANAPTVVSWLDPLADLHLAGLIMKIGGGLFLWGVIAALFFRWHTEEESGAPDLLYWRDLEGELEASTQS